MDMNCIHPGGEELTLEAAKACGWKEGDRILDVGCGGGGSMLLLKKTLGLKPVGCDMDEGMLARARLLDPEFKLRKTDGMSLDFPSLYFDGALLECSFSLMNRHDEMLNELYCVMKKGAKMAISDLYYINPDPDKAGEVYYEAKRILNTPRRRGTAKRPTRSPPLTCWTGCSSSTTSSTPFRRPASRSPISGTGPNSFRIGTPSC